MVFDEDSCVHSCHISDVLLSGRSGIHGTGYRGIGVVDDLRHDSGKIGTYRALIIGINNYQDTRIPDLETAVNVGRVMAKILQKRYGFDVIIMMDHRATRKPIYTALRKLADEAKPDDSVLTYYAGHGNGSVMAAGGFHQMPRPVIPSTTWTM